MAMEKDSVTHRELPTCFLLRHAIELFLKSTLIVAHRSFTGIGANYPAVLVDGKPKPMTNVHGVGPLYAALVKVLIEHQAELERRARTSWLPMPAELENAISEIDDMDARGVFFRYPTENNDTKSMNKPITAKELTGWDSEQGGALKAFVVLNKHDEFVEAYRYDANLLTRELAVLLKACHWLNSYHVGLRVELAGGW